MESLPRTQQDASTSLRERKKDRTRRAIQSAGLRLFAQKGFQATTIEEIAAAADVAPRTFFRYFATKEEIVFWPAYRPLLAEYLDARPDDEPAVAALCHAVVDSLAAFYDQDRERLLERLRLAFRTPVLHPRLRQEQAISALAMAKVLAGRLHASAQDLEIRAMAAAVAAALWVAVEEWQATDGRADMRTLIDRALTTVLTGDVRGRAAKQRDEPKTR
jgi:AcrR family transcriptional regulator